MNTIMNKPQPLKGFRDFLPNEKRNRDWVQNKIVETFEIFGFEPIETPTLEYASLLLGKYGDEADKLVYSFEDKGGRNVGLRYDQTVPTARVLGQYQNDLPKFFRRYQIQNVFRADKPQKGRFREFTQCDIDIFGSNSPINDAEILACTYAAYKNIGFAAPKILINDRNSLIKTLTPFVTSQVNVYSIIQTLDKLDKLSSQLVQDELVKKGLSKASALEILSQINNLEMSFELKQIVEVAINLGISKNDLVFSPTLARGLDYYTGMIFEVVINGYDVGSVGGGGRYDNLINELTGMSMSAVGMAFGFDRTVEAADALGLIPSLKSSSQVLVTIFDENLKNRSLETAFVLRQSGIKTEIYPNIDNLGKQFKLANQKNIPFVIVIGENETQNNLINLKNMTNGQQIQTTIEDAINRIKAIH